MIGKVSSFTKVFIWRFSMLHIAFFSSGSLLDLPAQTPIVHLTFSKGDQAQNKALIAPDAARYTVDLMRQQFAPGLADYALDLSEFAMHRRPWILDSLAAEQINTSGSFSAQVWVKTEPDATIGTPIIGNKKSDDLQASGWQIYTQGNGAWALNLSDGKTQHNYRPTVRQAINDGRWRQILISIERPKNEARMYFDGEAVAVYNLGSLGDLSSPLRTIIGGSDEYFEWGSAGQWKAFNGYIDEVKIWNRVVSAEEVKAEWLKFFPNQIKGESTVVPQQIKVMAWNIWHGGRRYGEQVGVKRTIETIRDAKADIVCLIETYGSGEKIADALGYHFYLISSNLSIMSRYPILETIEAFRAFNFGGAVVQLAPGKELLVFDTWLHYLPNYMKAVNEKASSPEELIAAEGETRHSELTAILREIEPYLKRQYYTGVLMAGDFNSGSHLDWIAKTKNIHNGYVVEWPESKAMTEAGFRDSFRDLHIDPATDPGYTWTPRAATSSGKYGIRDRIDYIYYQGKGLEPIYARIIDYHQIMFPSDHAAVLTVFKLN